MTMMLPLSALSTAVGPTPIVTGIGAPIIAQAILAASLMPVPNGKGIDLQNARGVLTIVSGILFILGSAAYLPNIDDFISLSSKGGWLFTIGSLGYVINDAIELYMVSHGYDHHRKKKNNRGGKNNDDDAVCRWEDIISGVNAASSSVVQTDVSDAIPSLLNIFGERASKLPAPDVSALALKYTHLHPMSCISVISLGLCLYRFAHVSFG
jgi:YrhK-like protein